MSAESLALGMFLRARRNVCQPEDHGIFREEGRRVPGLKRDEVARLAGISAEYYLRLEQGRSTRPSDQVLHSLARALHLDAESRQYLFRLASGDVRSAYVASEDSIARIDRILRPWMHAPAYVTDCNRDIIASNPLATVFGNGGLTVGANVAAYIFTDRMKKTLGDAWEEMARGTLAGLRRDAEPFSPRLNEIVDQLSGDRDFTRLWARHDVSGTEDAHVLHDDRRVGHPRDRGSELRRPEHAGASAHGALRAAAEHRLPHLLALGRHCQPAARRNLVAAD